MKNHMNSRNLLFGVLLLACLASACKEDSTDPRPTPKGIIFKSWSVEGLQPTMSNGDAWDDEDNTGPDVKLVLHHNGPVFYESDIIPDMVAGQKYEIDITPDIRLDSITDWYWELQDEYEPFFGPETIRIGYVSLIHDYLVPGSIILDGFNPRVTLQVEYIY